MGGLGKTTIAQMVFNDERITKRFELRIWVCVSEDFDVKRLIKAIIESACGKACEDLDLAPFERHLRDTLNGKRYLLVLDDVWSDDQEKWDILKHVLACGSRGSSIITTTRLEKVALIMGTLPIHHLSCLSKDDCWSLFKQRAFGNETKDHSNLVAIGKEIVKKCGSVPLAAKALEALCASKEERMNGFLLKKKDSRIEKDNLIHLWMANGFISSRENLELEDVGNEIWNELYLRSLFQELEYERYGHLVQCFKMHDLVHDFAQSVMKDDCHVMEVGRKTNLSNINIRHFRWVLHCTSKTGDISKALYKVKSLRALIFQCSGGTNMYPLSCDLSINCGLLRVFDANNITIAQRSSMIGKLKHLRYLNLSHSDIQTLPESICSLWNLQTLNLNACRYLQRLPKNMKYLRSLRHLYLKNCFRLIDTPPEIGRLTCLKTLSLFVVGKQRGRQLIELKGLNLGGELKIIHLERVRNLMDAKEANLVGKQNLRHLSLYWKLNKDSELRENVEQFLEALEPPPNIEVLVIRGYKGSQFPPSMLNSIPKSLVSISLSLCRNCLQLSPLGQLPSLRHLQLAGMENLEFIHNDSYGAAVRGFPSLETLSIREFPNLEGLAREEERELFTRLRRLTIRHCPKLSLPCLSSLAELRIRRCNNVVLSSIRNCNRLIYLDIGGSDEVISFPEELLQNLTVLQSLLIEGFTKLTVLRESLANLITLQSLHIIRCHDLESFPEKGIRGLASLKNLVVYHCNKLNSLSEGLQHLTTLERMDVSGCPELLVLPEGIRNLNSLQHLVPFH